jgi:small-conductance mechanosensitive channel
MTSTQETLSLIAILLMSVWLFSSGWEYDRQKGVVRGRSIWQEVDRVCLYFLLLGTVLWEVAGGSVGKILSPFFVP